MHSHAVATNTTSPITIASCANALARLLAEAPHSWILCANALHVPKQGTPWMQKMDDSKKREFLNGWKISPPHIILRDGIGAEEAKASLVMLLDSPVALGKAVLFLSETFSVLSLSAMLRCLREAIKRAPFYGTPAEWWSLTPAGNFTQEKLSAFLEQHPEANAWDEALMDTQMDLLIFCERERFIESFRIGAQFIIDALQTP